MIQRIQSVHLFFAALLMALLAFVPWTGYSFLHEGNTAKSLSSIWVLGGLIPGATYVGIAIIAACVLPLVTIFLYRRRNLQASLCIAEIILLLLIQAAILWQINALKSFLVAGQSLENLRVIYSPVAFFPIAAVILVFLARQGIVRDEKVVQSMHRIR